MFEQAMAMFSPFGKGAGSKAGEEARKDEPPKPAGQADEIAELKAQLASIQAKLERLSGESK